MLVLGKPVETQPKIQWLLESGRCTTQFTRRLFALPFFFFAFLLAFGAYSDVPCFCRLDTVETGRDSAYLGGKRFVNWSYCRYRGGMCCSILRRRGFAQ